MKLVELVEYLIKPQQLKKIYLEQGLTPESEALLVYMKRSLNIDSEITIFGIEETEDSLFFEKDGIRYIQLFPLQYAAELIETDLDLKDKGYSNLEIAKRLLEFREKDS